MKPADFLAKTKQMEQRLRDLKSKAVFVGLPAEKAGGKVYGDGMTILQVGAIHEYGMGNNPRRSFLREPFSIKRDELNKVIAAQFEKVTGGGQSVARGLGLIGVAATNISKGAFGSQGYGTWPDIKPATKREKGSSGVLIDTRVLGGSITWVTRDAS